jgi:hypothetical protein
MAVGLLHSPELCCVDSLMFLAARCLEQRLIFLLMSLISIARECDTVRRVVWRIQILHRVVEHVHLFGDILQKLLGLLTFFDLMVPAKVVEGRTHILQLFDVGDFVFSFEYLWLVWISVVFDCVLGVVFGLDLC